MLDLPQHRDLPDGRARDALTLGLELDLLEGDDLVCARVEALVDDTVGALSELLDLLDVFNLTEAELLLVLVYHDVD